jgi:hypothetical protein
MIVDGRLYRLQALAHHIRGIGGGVWPTPLASDAMQLKMGLKRELRKIRNRIEFKQESTGKWFPASLTETIWYYQNGGLNPVWVEWLMGYPIGWTGSEPLVTQ